MVGVQRRSVLTDEKYDYADAFEVTLGDNDTRSAEGVFRAGLLGAPKWLRASVLFAHRYVLMLDLAPLSAPNHIAGWEVLTRGHDLIRLAASGPLMDGVLVARRTSSSTAVLETFVRYRRPRPARVVWAFVAPVHRAVVPVLLRRAAGPSARR